MKEILRLFMQIALLRRGPQDLPASRLLLALTVIGYLAVNLVVESALQPDYHWSGPLLADAAFMLLWYIGALRLAGRPERILQTVTAIFGFQGVLSPLLIGSEWLMRRFHDDATWQAAVTCMGLLLLAWLIAANSHIVKQALEWSGTASVALVILQIVAGWVVVFTLFPPVKA
jgi:hypothetical protein